ncbi:MAG: hypothetical protein IJ733_04065, partial [Lachnospiraceae bacterium]|nr:hypothetical protein [Lachnospiraceae bacterium]
MPRPPRFTKDEEGKPYIWEAGENFSIQRLSEKVQFFSMDFYIAFGEAAERRQRELAGSTVNLPNALETESLEKAKKAVENFHGFNPSDERVHLSNIETVRHYLNEQEVANHKRYIRENAAQMHGMANRLRTEPPEMPEGDLTDEQTRDYQKQVHLWTQKQRIADHMDRYINVMDPEKGNYLEALANKPYMIIFAGLYGSDPQFGSMGFDQCIEGLDQLDIPDPSQRKPIFSTYMDMMDAFPVELEVEYHRQEMEKTGWDIEKEQTYLRELKKAHEFVIDKYDKLNAIEDD